MAENFGISVILKLIDQVSGPMTQLNTSFEKMGKRYKATGENLRNVGEKMSLYVTAPIMGMGVLAGVAASNFEEAFAEIKKSVKGTPKEMDDLKSSIVGMSQEIPFSVETLGKVAAAAGQLGIKNKDIAGFTRTMADFSKATGMDALESAKTFVQIGKVAGITQEDYSRLGSTIVELSDTMGVSEQDLMGVGLRMSGVGKQVGMSQAKILGLAAAFGSMGVDGERAGMTLNAVLLGLSKAAAGNKMTGLFGRITGLGAAGFQQLWKKDSTAALGSFLDGLGELNKKGVDVVGVLDAIGMDGGRTADVLLRMSGRSDVLNKGIKVGTDAWRENKAMMDDAAIAYGTNASKIDVFKNKLTAVLASFGEVVLPVFTILLSAIQPFLTMLVKLPAPIKTFIVIFAGVLALVGPIVAGIGMVAGAMAALGIAAAPVIGVVLAVAAGIAALVAAGVWLYQNWGKVAAFFQQLWDAPIVKALRFVSGVDRLMSLPATIVKAWGVVSSFFENLWTSTFSKFVPFLNGLDKVVGAARAVAGFQMGAVGSAVGGMNRMVAGGLQAAFVPQAARLRQAVDVNSKNSTDVTIKVDGPGQVKRVEKKEGDANVRVISAGYLGQFAGGQ